MFFALNVSIIPECSVNSSARLVSYSNAQITVASGVVFSSSNMLCHSVVSNHQRSWMQELFTELLQCISSVIQKSLLIVMKIINPVYIFINWHVILTVPDSNLQLQGSWRFESGIALVLSSSQLLLRGSVGFVMHCAGLHCVRCNQVFRSANFTAVGVERNTWYGRLHLGCDQCSL